MTAAADFPTDGAGLVNLRAPLQILTYRLTPADARLWSARAPGSKRRRRRSIMVALIIGVALVRGLDGRLPVIHALVARGVLAAALLILPLILGVYFAHRREVDEALSEVAADVDVRLEVFAKHVLEHRPDRRKPVLVRDDDVQDVVVGDNHLFLDLGRDVLIIPASAFAGRDDMLALARRWQD